MSHIEEIEAALKAARGRLAYAEDVYRHCDHARADGNYLHTRERLERDVRVAANDVEILESELERLRRDRQSAAQAAEA